MWKDVEEFSKKKKKKHTEICTYVNDEYKQQLIVQQSKDAEEEQQ